MELEANALLGHVKLLLKCQDESCELHKGLERQRTQPRRVRVQRARNARERLVGVEVRESGEVAVEARHSGTGNFEARHEGCQVRRLTLKGGNGSRVTEEVLK